MPSLLSAGVTLDHYDQVLAKMGRTGAAPPGSVFHRVTTTEDGIRMTDGWQTPEEFEAFAAQTDRPANVEVGFPAPPEIMFHDVHNHDSADSSAMGA